MRNNRIEKAIEIINYAIQNKISVKEASIKHGFAGTYVKNIKALVYGSWIDELIDKDIFNLFDNAYVKYTFSRGYSTKEDFNIEKPIKESKDKPKDIPSVKDGEDLKYNENGNEAVIEWKAGANYPSDHIKTLSELLKITKVDLNLWKVTNYWVNKWDVTAIIDSIPRTIQNFQIKARLERIIQKLEIVKEKVAGEVFIDMVKNYEPPVLKTHLNDIDTENSFENNLLEISIFDLHYGKLAWGGETGENFDTKIARERFITVIENLIQRASGFQYSKILFPVGNDFFNSDTIFNTTTKGTPQDEDLRWQKTFSTGVRLIVDAINLLKQTGVPIDVIVIPGNHDFQNSYYMGSFLEAWFRDDSMVNVNNGASPRKYYRFGSVLLGFTHGSEEKEGSLPMVMASDTESKPMWSETLYHEWHIGHIHRRRDVKYITSNKVKETSEDLGVTVRYLSSLTGTEEWHHKKGFIGAIKAGNAFVWNDNFGLVAQLNSNLIITE
jgi:hypothetical protein